MKKLLMQAIAAVTVAFSSMSAGAYTDVDYISTTQSKQNWLLLDYTPKANTIIEMILATRNATLTQGLFCSRGGKDKTSTDENTFTSFIVSAQFRFDYSPKGTGAAQGSSVGTGTKYQVVCDPASGLWVNDTQYGKATSIIPDFQAGNKLVLFASYTGETNVAPKATGNYSEFNVYRVRIWEGSRSDENLQFDLRPCKDDDGIFCLRDAKNGDKLYYSEGANAFGGTSAKSFVWQGASDGVWSEPTNWKYETGETATSAPADGTILKFENASTLTTVNDLDDFTVGGIVLNNKAKLTINGKPFKYTGEIKMDKPTADQAVVFNPDIELLTSLTVRFAYNSSGNKSRQLTFNGVLSGEGGLAVDTSNGSGNSSITLNGLNTFTGSVKYIGSNKYVYTAFKTIAPAGQPSSFGAGTDGIVIAGSLTVTGAGGATDRPWKLVACNVWNLQNTKPLVFENTFDFNGTAVTYGNGGTLKFKGQVLNLGEVKSTNGNQIYFESPDNTANSAKDIYIYNADFYVKKLTNSGEQSSVGIGGKIQIGQAYSTVAGLYYTGAVDAECNRTLDILGPTSGAMPTHTISVTNAAVTLDLSGTIKSSNSSKPNVQLAGAGALRTSGTMQNTYAVNKVGTNVWTHTGTATYSGATTITSGRFVLDGSMTSPITVKSGAKMSGTGTANDLTLQAGSTYVVDDLEQPLAVSGMLTVTGAVNLQAPSDWDGSKTTVLTFGASSPAGTITVTGVPFEAYAAFEDNALVIKGGRPPQACVWTGAVNGSWDLATKNWTGEQLFSDGSEVTFPAGAANREVTLPADVVSGAMTVDGADDYSFSGKAILGNALFTKTGAGTTTFSNATQFTAVNVNGGKVTLGSGGSIEKSTVTIASGATLKVDAGGAIVGESTVTVNGTYENRSMLNTYTGNTVLAPSSYWVTVYTDRTFGEPDAGYLSPQLQMALQFLPGIYLRKMIHKPDGVGLTLVSPASGRAGLYGDFAHVNGAGNLTVVDASSPTTGGILEFGEPGGTNRFYNVNGDFLLYTKFSFQQLKGTNAVEVNVKFNYSTGQIMEISNAGKFNYAQFNRTGNKWPILKLTGGLLRVGADEALASSAETYVVADGATTWACIDLRGHTQTLSNLRDYQQTTSAMAGEFEIRSTEGHGTLIFSSSSARSLIRPRTRFTGDLDIVKRGTGTLTFGFGSAAVSDQTGLVSVEGGTLKVTAPGVFGGATNVSVSAGATLAVDVDATLGASRQCCLDLADGATLSIPDDVTVTVAYAKVGNSGRDGKQLERGTYTKADFPNLISGGGKLVVKRGVAGMILLVL